MGKSDISDDPRTEIIDTLNEQMGTLKRKLAEMKAQIDQTQQMVDREQQRNSDYASDIQNIQANLDSIPREDIRDKYNEALDARFRLATMRGQLEKFQSQYDLLQKEQELLSNIASKFQGVDFSSMGNGDDEPTARVAPNIARIVEAQEEERQRLAHQMHDGPAQSLTNFILQADICQRLFNRDPERAAEELDNLKTVASVTFQKVRDFIFDLRPMMLDDLGVVPTVRRYIDSYKEKNDIETQLEILGEERRFAAHSEVMIFRAIQELVILVRDYASASNLRIKLDMVTDRIKIAVHDNGRGFDANAIFEEPDEVQDPRSKAMVALKERLELMGGTMEVHSTEADGTLVRLELTVD